MGTAARGRCWGTKAHTQQSRLATFSARVCTAVNSIVMATTLRSAVAPSFLLVYHRSDRASKNANTVREISMVAD